MKNCSIILSLVMATVVCPSGAWVTICQPSDMEQFRGRLIVYWLQEQEELDDVKYALDECEKKSSFPLHPVYNLFCGYVIENPAFGNGWWYRVLPLVHRKPSFYCSRDIGPWFLKQYTMYVRLMFPSEWKAIASMPDRKQKAWWSIGTFTRLNELSDHERRELETQIVLAESAMVEEAEKEGGAAFFNQHKE